MYAVMGKCPICGEDLTVTRLQCRNCATIVEGHFSLGHLSQLKPEQLHFVETFIRCEGKLNKAQEELGLSYPTVRSRLHDVIRALGYEAKDEVNMPTEQRKTIPDQLAQGQIRSDEAIRLLQGE
jgi:hypothetical protein